MAKRKTTPKAKLGDYHAKRDFDKTAEPAGGDVAASETGRLYLVQKHAARRLHYDFRLEFDGVLKSWAVPKGPSLDPSQKPLAVHTEDHPIEYGDFEGVIPKDEYGGGTVMLWDRGWWEPIGDAVAGYEKGDLKFRLHGEKLHGDWVLARMKGKSGKSGKAGEDGKNWLLIKKKDGESRSVSSFNVLAEMPFSVASGRSMEEIEADPEAIWKDGQAQPLGDGASAAEPRSRKRADRPDAAALTGATATQLPEGLAPQLATRVAVAPDYEGWLHEIKFDGYRMLCRLQGGEAKLLTRNGHDWTDRMPDVARAASRLPLTDGILDGEIVILDVDGRSDFQALQNAFRGYKQRPFVYYVFDVPYADGHDLRRVPLIERKAFLERVVRGAPLAAPTIQYCDHIEGKGAVVFEEAAAAGLEGIVCKRADSVYESGRRTDTWVKVKATHRQDFIVVGYTAPAKTRTGIGALLLAQHDDDGRLVYCGRVGTGFTTQQLDDLAEVLGGIVCDTPPVVNPKLDPEWRTVSWIEPRLVICVEFAQWTDEKVVRHASFIGLRPDTDPESVVREEAAPMPMPNPGPAGGAKPAKGGKVVKAPAAPADASVLGIRVSNPNRTVYPEDGVSKLDVAQYFATVAERMLPFVAKRPLSLVRCPLGLAGDSFYQRELGEGFPAPLRGKSIKRGRNNSEDHAILIDDAAGLVALVQMGVLEVHAWGCREDNLDRADHLVFDLDPGEGILWEHVVASAVVVRDLLAELELESFVKTSGGKGIHVVVPVARRTAWPQVKGFAKAVADTLARRHPLNFVSTMAKSQREHRIFIDYLRNQLGATSIAPYSTRARPGATVSTPLSWDELSPQLTPRDLTVRTVPDRLDDDPWGGYFDVRQTITAAMTKELSD